MMDTRREQVVDMQAVLSNLPSDTFVVDSEVQVLASSALAPESHRQAWSGQGSGIQRRAALKSRIVDTIGTVKATLRGALSWMGVPAPQRCRRPGPGPKSALPRRS